MKRRRASRPLVTVLASAVSTAGALVGPALAVRGGVVREAAANPPPPRVLPDPPMSAPTVDEPPSVIRKHEGLCYAFYASGGSLAVECPPELATEPLGEAILKNEKGVCQLIPFASGLPGSKGPMKACPAAFSVVAKAGVIPESSTKLAAEVAKLRPEPKEAEADEPFIAPPPPARLEATTPQQVGCTGCTTSRGGAPAAVVTVVTFVTPFGLAALAAARRRRRA
jgi:MYXO-CTERM domain-containing protein